MYLVLCIISTVGSENQGKNVRQIAPAPLSGQFEVKYCLGFFGQTVILTVQPEIKLPLPCSFYLHLGMYLLFISIIVVCCI